LGFTSAAKVVNKAGCEKPGPVRWAKSEK